MKMKFYDPDMTVQEMINDRFIKNGSFNVWLRYYKKSFISEQMKPFIEASNKFHQIEMPDYLDYRTRIRSSSSWLRSIREALFLSGVSVSEKLKESRASFGKIEKSEIAGTASLNQLRKAAEALDCELVYAIIPKDKVTPAEKVWEILYPLACKTKFVENVSRAQRMNGIATAARMLMEDYKFRQQQGWATHAEVSEGGVFREITRLQAQKLGR